MDIVSAALSHRGSLLDEPMNGLDPEGICWNRDRASDQATARGNMLVFSFRIELCATGADSLILIDRGCTVTCGRRSRMENAGAKLEQLGALAADAHIEPCDLSSFGTSLESIYIQLTLGAVEYAAQPEETMESR